MSIIKEPFGAVEKYTLRSGNLELALLTYGAAVQALKYRGLDLALGYDNLEDYQRLPGCLGAIVGRSANRIARGRFWLGGKEFHLSCNDGKHHLHGGFCGFDKRIWSVVKAAENALTLRLESPDGEEGYPGNLWVEVTYALEEDTLSIFYNAQSDADTLFNPTNHCYFNLNGIDGPSIDNHLLQLYADAYTPPDEERIPLGTLASVEGTKLDLRRPKPIPMDCDYNFALCGEGYRLVASALSPRSGIGMECYTDRPGLQLFSADALSLPAGKAGPIGSRAGFCLETQVFPDAPNHSAFPSSLLRAGELFCSKTAYRFFAKAKREGEMLNDANNINLTKNATNSVKKGT